MKRLFVHICFVWVLLSLVFIGCSSKMKPPRPKGYAVARDATWYPLNLMGKADNVFAFSENIVVNIGSIEKFPVTLTSASWNTLVFNLWRNEYDAILTSMNPTDANLALYDFSDMYLSVGDVLVVSANSKANALVDMQGKILGILVDSNAVLAAEEFPSVIIRPYSDIARALDDLEKGRIDGVLMGVLPAYTFCKNIYNGRLRVVTAPVDGKGLRLATLKDKFPELIEAFNGGLRSLREDGEYDELLRKWGLDQ